MCSSDLALHVAVRSGQTEMAQMLLESGASVDIRDHNEFTDRKSVVKGKSVDLGGGRIIKKKKCRNIRA